MNELFDYTENEQTIEEIEIEAYLNALKSTFVQARKSAIVSLQDYYEVPQVIKELRKRVHEETDLDCIEHLEQIITLAESSKKDTSVSYSIDPQELANQWFQSSAGELQGISNWVSSLKPNIQVDFICKVIDEAGTLRQERLLPLFVNRKLRCFHKPEVTDRLIKLIPTKNTFLLVRILTLLGNSKPAVVLPYLPKLLLHRLLQIRLQSIRILYKTIPSEAIRLLREIVFSDSATHTSSALHLFFLIPFNHIADIIIRLIDMAPLSERDEKLVCHLIYNNPNKQFFEKLTLLYLRRREDIPRLIFYWKIAAKALILAEIVDIDEAQLLRKAVKDARRFAFKTSGIDILYDNEHEEIENNDEELKKHVILDTFKQLDQISGKQTEELIAICRAMSESKDIINAIKVIKGIKSKNRNLLRWLEELFDFNDVKITSLTMGTILELDKSRLLPHLRHLVHNTNQIISGQSIRMYRKHFPKEFSTQIKFWINEEKETSWQVALTGLMQMSIEKSREILLAFFKTKESPDLIKFFGPVFLITPDRETVYSLLEIATHSSKLKQKSLSELIEQLKSELEIFSEFEDSSIKKQWEEAAIKIKQIHYYTSDKLASQKWRQHLTNPVFIFFIAFMIITGIYTLTFSNRNENKDGIKQYQRQKESFKAIIPMEQQKEFLKTKLQNFEEKMLAKPMLKPKVVVNEGNSLQVIEAITSNLNEEMQDGIKQAKELELTISKPKIDEVSND